MCDNGVAARRIGGCCQMRVMRHMTWIGGGTHAAHTLEEWARHAMFAGLTRGSNRARHVEPGELRRPLRTLVIAEDAIGDTILTLPMIRAIHDASPGNIVDVVTWPTAALLFDAVPYVRRVVCFPRYDARRIDAARTIRKLEPYDAVVDTMVLREHVRSRALAMMLASGARYWVGEGGRGSDYLLNVRVPHSDATTPHVERLLALAQPFGGDTRQMRPLLCVTADERSVANHIWGSDEFRVLVNVSTNGKERQWDTSRFARVVSHVRRRKVDASILVVAMEADRAKAAHAAGDEAQVVVPSLRELIALVESADLVISPDTAVCHLASAFRRTLVSIHNSGKSEWLPFDTPGRRIIGSAHDSFDVIGAGEVIGAVDLVLAELNTRPVHAAAGAAGYVFGGIQPAITAATT
jgi:ADP-heptose:LPS heptosyltransferase